MKGISLAQSLQDGSGDAVAESVFFVLFRVSELVRGSSSYAHRKCHGDFAFRRASQVSDGRGRVELSNIISEPGFCVGLQSLSLC